MAQLKVNNLMQVAINTDILMASDQEAIKQKMFNYKAEKQPENLPFLMREMLILIEKIIIN